MEKYYVLCQHEGAFDHRGRASVHRRWLLAFPPFSRPLALSAREAKVLAKVNGVEITDEDMKFAIEDIGPGIPRQLEGKARDAYMIDLLVDEQLVVQKAQAEKLSETPEFAKRLGYMRDKALMETLLGKVAKDAVTDAAIKETYDDAAKNQKPDTEYHAHHILVETEDQAKAAQKRVKGGEDFAKVATELSKDPGAKGGDLGWFTKDRMVPEFGEAVFKMEPGQISEPVKIAVRLAYHQARRKARQDFPPLGSGARSGRALRRAEGAERRGRQAARTAPRSSAPTPRPATPRKMARSRKRSNAGAISEGPETDDREGATLKSRALACAESKTTRHT